MASRRFEAISILMFMAFCGAIHGQDAAAEFTLQGLENRPYRVQVFHPLTQTTTLMEEGQVGMKGQIRLEWPDDGRLHFLELECAGVVWSLPVCGPYDHGAELAIPPLGGAPFAARPGSVLWTGEQGREWTPVLVSQAQGVLTKFEQAMAADLQQAMLWDGPAGAPKDKAVGVLGISIGEGPVEEVNQDSLWSAYQVDFQRAYGAVLDRCSQGAERDYVDALQGGILPELYPDSAATWERDWASRVLPAPNDAGEVEHFLQGLSRAADFEGWSLEERQELRRALTEGDMDSLVTITSVWWGSPDVDRTKAWFLARCGDGGMGVQFPRRFERSMEVPAGVRSLLEACLDHPQFAASSQRLLQKLEQPGTLPAALRAFSASGSLMRMEEWAESGPVAWLWIDASAPTTVVQLQVLERMMTSTEGPGRRGKAPFKDLKWIVVDAGQDWAAFEQLIRTAAARHGGLRQLPYTLLHTGGDLRWTEAFEIQALPAMRHSGPGLVPTPEVLPMPGPALTGWLAKRS